jgi:hypothetical protein
VNTNIFKEVGTKYPTNPCNYAVPQIIFLKTRTYIEYYRAIPSELLCNACSTTQIESFCSQFLYPVNGLADNGKVEEGCGSPHARWRRRFTGTRLQEKKPTEATAPSVHQEDPKSRRNP